MSLKFMRKLRNIKFCWFTIITRIIIGIKINKEKKYNYWLMVAMRNSLKY